MVTFCTNLELVYVPTKAAIVATATKLMLLPSATAEKSSEKNVTPYTIILDTSTIIAQTAAVPTNELVSSPVLAKTAALRAPW